MDDLKNMNHFNKYWWVWLSAAFVVIGTAGIIYVSLIQAKNNKVVDTTPKITTASEIQAAEKESKAIDAELSLIINDIKQANSEEAALDDAPTL